MRIATNVNRDAFGGITISNLALFDWLEPKSDEIVGIEYFTARHLLGPVVFRKYDPVFFRHHIVNSIDVVSRWPWEHALSEGWLRRQWRELIETTKDILRDEQAEVVLVNGTYFAPWILSAAARELGIPTVLRYHGVLRREVAHKSFIVRNRLLAYERSIANHATAIIYPSSLCKAVVEREVVNRSVPSTVIPNSVTPLRQLRHRKHSKPIIAAIGRWTPIKNFETFIRIHQDLRKSRWSHDAVLVTNASGGRVHVPSSIERRNPMSQHDLRKFYASIDLLIVPSHFETFCNVAAEALMIGTPVLVSEHVGIAEVLKSIGLGRMVIPTFDDAEMVVRTVKQLCTARVTKEERTALAAALNPHLVHDRIVSILHDVKKR